MRKKKIVNKKIDKQEKVDKEEKWLRKRWLRRT